MSNEVPKVTFKPPEQYVDNPVNEIATSQLDRYLNLFWLAGVATRRSRAGFHITGNSYKHEDFLRVSRSPYNRTRRAKILEEVKVRGLTSEMGELVGNLDELDKQFLNQGMVSVDMGELGIQQASYTLLNPPNKNHQGNPIFLVPALSGDLNGVEPLAREAFLLGRKVMVVGYPESHMGRVTDEFTKASVGNRRFDWEPHTSFFKALINYFRNEGNIELWGYSTGCGVIADILQDKNIQDKITNAVLFAPAGTSNQHILKFLGVSLTHEMYKLFDNTFSREGLRDLSSMSFVTGSRFMDKSQKMNRDKVFKHLLKNRVCRLYPNWHLARVKEGGKIILESGGKDYLTRSGQFIDQVLTINPHVAVVDDPDGFHMTPLLNAHEIVPKVDELTETIEFGEIVRI